MKHQYTAKVSWIANETRFTDGKYSRAHKWSFDCGIEIEASASPLIVPFPYSREDAVDPEEAFIAAISSCHMLTFLYLAAKHGLKVVSYTDHAVGYMETQNGRTSITQVILRPEIRYQGPAPLDSKVNELHDVAHEECFIANSVKTEIKIQQAQQVVV